MNSPRWIAWTKYYTASILRFLARFCNINNPLIQSGQARISLSH